MNKTTKTLAGSLLLATVYNPVLAAPEGNTSASGIKVGVAFDQGFGITAQFDNKINAFIGNDGLSMDYILKKGAFSSDVPINWYVGIGGAINWDDHNNDNSYSVRVPLGASIPFAKSWDVYGQVAPDFALKDRHDNNDNDYEFGIDLALGVRYGF
tara:strand:- start:10462 stop:10926 length:465 start_codon:yes stop_codon:yes gene_type:complete